MQNSKLRLPDTACLGHGQIASGWRSDFLPEIQLVPQARPSASGRDRLPAVTLRALPFLIALPHPRLVPWPPVEAASFLSPSSRTLHPLGTPFSPSSTGSLSGPFRALLCPQPCQPLAMVGSRQRCHIQGHSGFPPWAQGREDQTGNTLMLSLSVPGGAGESLAGLGFGGP